MFDNTTFFWWKISCFLFEGTPLFNFFSLRGKGRVETIWILHLHTMLMGFKGTWNEDYSLQFEVFNEPESLI